VTFEEQDGKTLLAMHELYPSKEALDAAGTGSADATVETFALQECDPNEWWTWCQPLVREIVSERSTLVASVSRSRAIFGVCCGRSGSMNQSRKKSSMRLFQLIA
jgi:hypothetical protein